MYWGGTTKGTTKRERATRKKGETLFPEKSFHLGRPGGGGDSKGVSEDFYSRGKGGKQKKGNAGNLLNTALLKRTKDSARGRGGGGGLLKNRLREKEDKRRINKAGNAGH